MEARLYTEKNTQAIRVGHPPCAYTMAGLCPSCLVESLASHMPMVRKKLGSLKNLLVVIQLLLVESEFQHRTAEHQSFPIQHSAKRGEKVKPQKGNLKNSGGEQSAKETQLW